MRLIIIALLTLFYACSPLPLAFKMIPAILPSLTESEGMRWLLAVPLSLIPWGMALLGWNAKKSIFGIPCGILNLILILTAGTLAFKYRTNERVIYYTLDCVVIGLSSLVLGIAGRKEERNGLYSF